MKISIVTTGGTIDKDYASSAGTYNFEISSPAIKNILSRVNPNFEFEIYAILRKDSLDITDKDRNSILKTCKNIENNKILITHGTDTMTKTAEILDTIKDKTIVITGSSKPDKFSGSDASFNVGCAIGALNCKEKGIFIAMNGIIYNWKDCHKEKETGQFIE